VFPIQNSTGSAALHPWLQTVAPFGASETA
jgi:hypothetical protein